MLLQNCRWPSYLANETDVTLESSSSAAEMRRTLPEQLLAVSRGYTMFGFLRSWEMILEGGKGI